MDLALALDGFGRLICNASFGSQHATVTCSDREQGAADLDAAFHDALRDGAGECYWREATGEYRWVFRRSDNGKIRIAVLWSNGTLTGWDQLLWTEVDASEFESKLAGAVQELNAVR